MAEIFKFFNSAPGDERWHYASDFADYFGSVLSSGLLHENNKYGLQVTVNSGTLTTNVAVGKALIKGYSYENTNDLTLTHSLPEQTLDRIDRVVLRLDLRNANRFIKAFVKEGVSATNPIAPDLQRDNYVYELSLATVRVRANTSSISVNDITDTRALEDVCGIAQSLITVPTSVFQQQFDAWFDGIADTTEQSVHDWQTTQEQTFSDWFTTVQNTLDGDIAASLANQITTHKADNTAHGIGDKTQLLTTEKNSLVGALNEVFTNADNGKNAIANAIVGKGGTASSSDTFTQLASAIGAIGGGIESVQRIEVNTSSATQGTISIGVVDLNKSVIIVINSLAGLPNTSTFTAKFESNGSVKWERYSGSTNALDIEVIEFSDIKNIQTLEVAVTSSEVSKKVAISSVDMSKSIIFHSMRANTTDNKASYIYNQTKFSASNELTITKAVGYQSTHIIQVVEFN